MQNENGAKRKARTAFQTPRRKEGMRNISFALFHTDYVLEFRFVQEELHKTGFENYIFHFSHLFF